MSAERLQLQPKAIAYESRFDRKESLKVSYISRQLDTFLGERLNVLLSQNRYEIKNDLIYGQDMDEPFIEVIRRGVEYRRKAEGENRVDKKREEAEVEGFLKLQNILCNPSAPIDTMMLSISPQGGKDSLYQHNFYDIFTLKEFKGKRFIEVRRYSSALTIAEYKDLLRPLTFVGNILDDADFLGNPIEIDLLTSLRVFFENADQIHSYLHKDHEFMKLEDFQRVLFACEYLKQKYIQTRDPRILDAMMNKVDMEAGFYDRLIGTSKLLTADQEINFYGHQPVRTVATGCGSSGSTLVNNFDKKFAPFSVLDFGLGEDMGYKFDQPGPCKNCGSNASCGPCGICRPCDLAIKAKNKFSLN